jgi:hypothetical protein
VALRWERRHLVQKTWYHKRLGGRGVGEPPEDCCFLLLSDPADQFLLLQDGCLELLNCQPEEECCILTEDSNGGTFVVLTEDDVDGTSCIEPEDCP